MRLSEQMTEDNIASKRCKIWNNLPKEVPKNLYELRDIVGLFSKKNLYPAVYC